MDTVVIATEIPFFLVFFDQAVSTVVEVWQDWVRTDQLVRAQHENPDNRSLILLHPAQVTTVQFVPNEPGRWMFGTQTLYTLPRLMSHPAAADAAPEHTHYWTLQGTGFSARFDIQPNPTTELILGNWEPGRI